MSSVGKTGIAIGRDFVDDGVGDNLQPSCR